MHVAARQPAEAQPKRLGALAKLPVFLNLDGRRAILAGGTAAAAWKAELLAAAGAHVDVYAAELAPEMAQLLERGAARGSLVHHAETWSAASFANAAVALADVETVGEAACFFAAAKAAGVPVNVIDKPAFCQFQFGSIVNRSPIVIGISTDGAAPILAQAIRRRIETVLPPSLAAWGALARQVRDAVMTKLEKGLQRRAFWERFAERAFVASPAADEKLRARALIEEVAAGTNATTGRVTIVGAGPGDAELLTLKAVRALQSADVILFDDLVSEDVLELARREAKRMLVGKRGGEHSCRQDDINALMVKLATQGRHVVRLKSGDPTIFGRAGEEIAELKAHGIPVTLVPGITAGLAMASALGVSLTHRDHAQSVRFVTGHARTGELPADLDWRGLADPATTLVLYMGGRTGPEIARRLMADDLSGETPVVIIAGVTRPDEWRWNGTLIALGSGSVALPAGLPVLMGIGQAFGRNRTSAELSALPQVAAQDAPTQPALETTAAA